MTFAVPARRHTAQNGRDERLAWGDEQLRYRNIN